MRFKCCRRCDQRPLLLLLSVSFSAVEPKISSIMFSSVSFGAARRARPDEGREREGEGGTREEKLMQLTLWQRRLVVRGLALLADINVVRGGAAPAAVKILEAAHRKG
jgi:hypothetical protein